MGRGGGHQYRGLDMLSHLGKLLLFLDKTDGVGAPGGSGWWIECALMILLFVAVVFVFWLLVL